MALALIALGGGLRLYLAIMLPVGYDEVFVMGLGLDAMRAGPAAALFDVPVTRSTAVAPLWWWLQYIPNGLLFDLSLAGLRVGPVLLGVATLVLAWRCAARRFGRRTALIFLGFCALSDILIFTNSRGEFAESLTTPLIVLLVCASGRSGWAVRRGAVGALLLLTVLVKSLLVVGVVLPAEGVVAICRAGTRRARMAGVAASLAIAIVPIGIFLISASVYFSGQKIRHDALTTAGVAHLVRALVFDYPEIKAHVTGSLRDAAFVLLDFDVWPVTVMAAPMLLAAAIGAAGRCGWRGCAPRTRRSAARAVLLIWTVVGAAVVIGRGTLGARFHLLYLPAAWMLAALWLSERRAPMAPSRCAGGVIAWAAYVGTASAWVDWSSGVLDLRAGLSVGAALAAVLLLGGWWARVRQVRLRPALVVFAIAAATVALASAGPFAWGAFARFEPMPHGPELAVLDALRSGREAGPPPMQHALFLDLTDYYLYAAPDTAASRSWALHYAEKAADEAPGDALAWKYLGHALVRNGGAAVAVRDAWRRSLALAPNERLAARLAQLEATLNAAP